MTAGKKKKKNISVAILGKRHSLRKPIRPPKASTQIEHFKIPKAAEIVAKIPELFTIFKVDFN
jgi:hypothetical protein